MDTNEKQWLRPVVQIDCRDLFEGNDSREKIVIFETDSMDYTLQK